MTTTATNKGIIQMKTNNVSKVDNSNAMVVVSNMTASEALAMHTSVKNQGSGSVIKFIKSDTPYTDYKGYYRELSKLGVMPFSSPKPVKTKTKVAKLPAVQNPLEARIQQLEMLLEAATVTPSKRAMDLLVDHMDDVDSKSRRFLCDVVGRNSNSLTAKQEKWLCDLENLFN